jgi:hypothetical protein
MTFEEGISHKFPGYGIDNKFLIYNKEDIDVDLDELKSFLLSKDLDLYQKMKGKFFGRQTRFLNGK